MKMAEPKTAANDFFWNRPVAETGRERRASPTYCHQFITLMCFFSLFFSAAVKGQTFTLINNGKRVQDISDTCG